MAHSLRNVDVSSINVLSKVSAVVGCVFLRIIFSPVHSTFGLVIGLVS
jgi:hypothetical protein